MTSDIEHVVGQLRRAGLRPSERQWAIIREAGPAAVPFLLELALDDATLVGSEPAAFGPVHALRLLGELPAPEPTVIERLLQVKPLPEEALDKEAPYIWQRDLPQIIGRWGRASYEPARQLLLDTAADADQRGLAAETLGFAVEIDGELREEVVALLRDRLLAEEDPYVMAMVVAMLGHLGVSEAYADVMAAYRRGAVDKTVISAADARQLLLNPPVARRRLQCVHHTLTERYDQHGPYSDEQRQAMAELQQTRH